MKKTLALIASAVLAAAAAQADALYTTSFAGTTITTSSDYLTGASVSTNASTVLTADLAANLLAPSTQMKENNLGWTSTFTFTATEDISITDITLGFQFVTANGERHGNSDSKEGTATITLTNAAGTAYTLSGWSFSRPDADKNSGGSTPTADVKTMSFSAPITIAVGETFTLAVNPVAAKTGGTYLGLSTMSLGGAVAVPEPATATLSLLALAGLAARRRRK